MTKITSNEVINASLSCDFGITTNIETNLNIECNTSIGKGDKGDTPIKGVDYFTEEDILELGIDEKVNSAFENFDTSELLKEVNNKILEIGIDISGLKKEDANLNLKIIDILEKMDDLVRYSKGEIHDVIIY